VYEPTGVPFNDAYRHVDWLLTVPLLLIEAVAVLALAKNVSNGMAAGDRGGFYDRARLPR